MLPLPVPRSRILGCFSSLLRRVFFGASGKERRVKKRRTFSGALCSENQDVPGSSSSFTSESEFEFSFSSSFASVVFEMWANVRA